MSLHPQHPRRLLLVGLGSIVLAVAAGCDKAPGLATVPAGGTVSYQGKPVGGAQVTLMPRDAASGRPATGESDAQGRFTLQTPAGGSKLAPGALAGDYTVIVVKKALGPSPATPMSQSEWSKLSKEEQDKRRAGMSLAPSVDRGSSPTGDAAKTALQSNAVKPEDKSELPKKYAQAATSGLEVSVKAGETNDFKLDLAD